MSNTAYEYPENIHKLFLKQETASTEKCVLTPEEVQEIAKEFHSGSDLGVMSLWFRCQWSIELLFKLHPHIEKLMWELAPKVSKETYDAAEEIARPHRPKQ